MESAGIWLSVVAAFRGAWEVPANNALAVVSARIFPIAEPLISMSPPGSGGGGAEAAVRWLAIACCARVLMPRGNGVWLGSSVSPGLTMISVGGSSLFCRPLLLVALSWKRSSLQAIRLSPWIAGKGYREGGKGSVVS